MSARTQTPRTESVLHARGRSVYQTGWFPYPPERRPKSIYFDTSNDEFAVAKSDAKFKVAKEGDLYQLTPLF